LGFRASHDRPDPRQEFAKIEWLDQVIVGADLQALDPAATSSLAERMMTPCLCCAIRLGHRQAIELGIITSARRRAA